MLSGMEERAEQAEEPYLADVTEEEGGSREGLGEEADSALHAIGTGAFCILSHLLDC